MAEDEAGIEILRLTPRVPNTYTFDTLNNVKPVIEHWHGGTSNNTIMHFNKAETKNFNPKYQGDRNSTKNFRDYGPVLRKRYYRRASMNRLPSSILWRVPSLDDYITLAEFIALSYSGLPYYTYYNDMTDNDVGRILKSCRQVDHPLGGSCITSTHPRWNEDHHNVYGYFNNQFNVLPGGIRKSSISEVGVYNAIYENKGSRAFFWTSNYTHHEGFLDRGRIRVGFRVDTSGIFIDGTNEGSYYFIPSSGCSIRLVRDANESDPPSFSMTRPDDYKGNDGKIYNTIRFGDQVWMDTNLRETLLGNKKQIPLVTDTVNWAKAEYPARCFYLNNSSSDPLYGTLYNHYSIVESYN